MAETPFSPDSTPGETAAIDVSATEAVGFTASVTFSDGSGSAEDGGIGPGGSELTGEAAAEAGVDGADSSVGEVIALVPEPAATATASGVVSIDMPAATAATDAPAWSAPEATSPELPATVTAPVTTSTAAASPLSAPQAVAPPLATEAAAEPAIPAAAAWSPAEPATPAESTVPAPDSAPAAAAAPPEAPAEAMPAGIAVTIAVPPLEPAAGEGEGGEWELLVGQLNTWFSSGELNRQWQKIRGPLKGAAILIGVILTLRLYASVVGTIDRIPVVSGLLELIGLISLGHFGLTKMVRTSEREQVLANWRQRWQAFRG